MVHVGTNNRAVNTTESIKADYKAVGRKLKGMELQEGFSSCIPVIGRGIQWEHMINRSEPLAALVVPAEVIWILGLWAGFSE